MDNKEIDAVRFDESVNPEPTDEALEVLGGAGVTGAYTLGACTGLSVCPA